MTLLQKQDTSPLKGTANTYDVNLARDPHAQRKFNELTNENLDEMNAGSEVEEVLGSVHISKPSIQHVFFLLRPILKPLLERFNKLEEELHALINEAARSRVFDDKPVSLSQNIGYSIDYRNRKFLHIMTLNPGSPQLIVGGNTLPGMDAAKWYPLEFARGTTITCNTADTAPISFIVRASDHPIAQYASILSGSSVALAAGTANIGNVGTNINGGGNNQNSSNVAFWNAAVVGAAGLSASANIPGYGKVRIFVTTSVADTFNVQISDDGGTTWYTLTQDNAGTPLIIATTATQLSSCRDIATFGSSNIRLLAIGAATITAGYQAETV